MPLSRSRDYLSIGEVLDALRGDFPDVTISKIRFLESEGLIAPERTGAGYRKFYERDLNRLRYILSLQRDHFLPLKVIRERLDEKEPDDGPPPVATAPDAGPGAASSAAAQPAMTGVQLSRDELLNASGLTEDQLGSLEEFGILRTPDGSAYDENDLTVATVARSFFDYGVEARHLRMYRQAAEREAAFFEQIVAPVALRRDPEGQQHAARSMHELLSLSRRLREAVLRSSLQGPL